MLWFTILSIKYYYIIDFLLEGGGESKKIQILQKNCLQQIILLQFRKFWRVNITPSGRFLTFSSTMVGPFLTLIHLLLQTIIIILPVSIDITKEYIFVWTDLLLKFSSDKRSLCSRNGDISGVFFILFYHTLFSHVQQIEKTYVIPAVSLP